jgi:hypothetical protein
MTLFTVDGDGSPLGIAATRTAEAAVDLVRLLCRAHELAEEKEDEFRPVLKLSARPASAPEEQIFQKSQMAGSVRLAGILISQDQKIA